MSGTTTGGRRSLPVIPSVGASKHMSACIGVSLKEASTVINNV